MTPCPAPEQPRGRPGTDAGPGIAAGSGAPSTCGASMTDRPILFSGPMVRAILAGRKTQTRRVITDRWGVNQALPPHRCPYGVPGDRLWVKETCRIWWDGASVGGACVEYRADGAKVDVCGCGRIIPGVGAVDGGSLSEFMQTDTRWRPSIYMPRAASRLTLEVTEIRVQRVQDITDDDIVAEGVGADWHPSTNLRATFERLWDSINGERGYPWASNPWVWCVLFRRVTE